MRAARLAIGAALMAATLAACGSSNGPSSDNDALRMVWIGPLSGPAGTIGKWQEAATQETVKELNDQGGVLGRKIEVEFLDTGADPARAVSAYQKAQSEGAIDLLMPGMISAEASAVLPIAARSNVITISPALADAVGDTEKYPLHFSTGPSFKSLASGFVGALVDQPNPPKKVALLYGSDLPGKSELANVTARLEQQGVEIVGNEVFAPTDTDLTAAVSKLSQSGADALLFGVAGVAALNILTAVDTVGWNVPIYGSTLAGANLYDGQAPDRVLDRFSVYYYRVSHESGRGEADTASLDAFITSVRAYPGVGAKADLFQLTSAHDAVMLYAAGVEGANSIDPEKVSDFLRSNRLEQGKELFNFSYEYTDESNFVKFLPESMGFTSPRRGASGLLLAN